MENKDLKKYDNQLKKKKKNKNQQTRITISFELKTSNSHFSNVLEIQTKFGP